MQWQERSRQLERFVSWCYGAWTDAEHPTGNLCNDHLIQSLQRRPDEEVVALYPLLPGKFHRLYFPVRKRVHTRVRSRTYASLLERSGMSRAARSPAGKMALLVNSGCNIG